MPEDELALGLRGSPSYIGMRFYCPSLLLHLFFIFTFFLLIISYFFHSAGDLARRAVPHVGRHVVTRCDRFHSVRLSPVYLVHDQSISLSLGGYLPFEEPWPEDVEDGIAEDETLEEIIIRGKVEVCIKLLFLLLFINYSVP